MRIAIVMPVKNGARFLRDQLSSLSRQTVPDWVLLASDDGSTDESSAVIGRHFANTPNRVRQFDGPCKGIGANVFSILARVGDDVEYVAYCDQDDVWEPEKLERALAALKHTAVGQPALYCGPTTLIDAAGQKVGVSPRHRCAPSFENAIVQNIASGNTMVMNTAALNLLRSFATKAIHLPYHDWWTYQLVSGAGGQVIFDACATVRYRQHQDNAVGTRVGLQRGLRRASRAFSGEHASDLSAHLDALMNCRAGLTPNHRRTLETFAKRRSGRAFGRLNGVIGSGIHRSTIADNLGLWATAALGRL